MARPAESDEGRPRMSEKAVLLNLDRAALTPVVRRALGSPTAGVSSWEARPLRDQWNPVTGGLYRVRGTASGADGPAPWSVVLKVCRDPGLERNRDPRHPGYWRREYLAYSSGLLADLPPGVRAARCYGAEERPAGQAWLWLEDLTNAHGTPWPLERYGLAARHAGQLNGAYLAGRPLPEHPWLLDGAPPYEAYRQPIERLREVADHPLVRREFADAALAECMARLWAERAAFYAALARLPRCLCHLDLFRSNLFAVRGADGHDETVAVDWQMAGTAAVGAELAPLVCASPLLTREHAARVRDLGETAFEGYLAGLRDAGWHGDAGLARLGYAAGVPRFAIALSVWAALDPGRIPPWERTFGPFAEYVERSVYTLRYVVELADEARALMARLLA